MRLISTATHGILEGNERTLLGRKSSRMLCSFASGNATHDKLEELDDGSVPAASRPLPDKPNCGEL